MKVYGELQSAQVENVSADPTNLPDGRIWLNTTDAHVRTFHGGSTRLVYCPLETLLADANKVFVRTGTGTLTHSFLVDANISPSANIAYGKLALTGSIVNSDIAAGAAIAYSKLNLGSSIQNSDVAATAAIALSKLAATTASRVIVSDSSGVLSPSAVTATDVAILAGLAGKALVTTTDAQTLTNKTLTSPTINGGVFDALTLVDQISQPSNAPAFSHKIYVDSTTGKATLLDSSGNKSTIGSGAGSGGVNYIAANPDGEASTTGYAAYSNTAQSSPVTGTGGTPAVTITRSTASPLRGLASFLVTKDAVNRQGQGVAYPFTIDAADQAKVLQISFDYILASGTFTAGSAGVDSDVTVWIYDVTNGVVIQPTTYKLFSNSASTSNSFIGSFQTASNSTSYRLIFHCGTTSAAAYTLKLDNISVAPTQYAYNTVITDWQSYTPTFQGFGTPTSIECFWRRVGGDAEYLGKFIPGTTTAVAAQIGLAAGQTINSTAVPSIRKVGQAASASTAGNTFSVLATGATAYLNLGIENNASFAPLTAQNGSSYTSSVAISFFAKVPILGWSVQQQTSDINDQRIVAARYWLSTSTSQATSGGINFDTKDYDTHSSVTTGAGAWKFTAPVAGVYRIGGFVYGGGGFDAKLYKNGTLYGTAGNGTTASSAALGGSIQLNAGDFIDIRPTVTLTPAATSGGTLANSNFITVERIANPAQISATETIAASYWLSTNTAVSSGAVIKFDSKEYDTHGAYSAATGQFTALSAGLYAVSGFAATSSGTGQIMLYKNGSAYKTAGFTGGAGSVPATLSTRIRLNAGDTIDLRPNAAITFSGGALATASTGHIQFERVGI